mmetsp:Transcript_529/g.919  ORF Transcript_529/g.919 Transcript_529/m.919 type:complete len:159 (+) Transcript_529:3163-3639(+)
MIDNKKSNQRILMASSTTSNFEASFSNGLDLSEFSSSSLDNDNFSNSPKIKSASAELFRVKEHEAMMKQIEETQEIIMQKQAAIKAREQLKRFDESHRREETKSDAFYGVIVSMHVSDASGGKKDKKHAKTKAQKRTVAPKFKKNSQRNAQNRNHKNI